MKSFFWKAFFAIIWMEKIKVGYSVQFFHYISCMNSLAFKKVLIWKFACSQSFSIKRMFHLGIGFTVVFFVVFLASKAFFKWFDEYSDLLDNIYRLIDINSMSATKNRVKSDLSDVVYYCSFDEYDCNYKYVNRDKMSLKISTQLEARNYTFTDLTSICKLF